tara:strand:+ start:110 stop:820 length:711 start_codon:yes stop_codon:yes gene_type:complete
MKYSNLTIFSNNFLKRFSHNERFNIATNILKKNYLKNNVSVLDYGTGSGDFLKKIYNEIPNLKNISGYEPLKERYQEVSNNISNYENITVYKSINDIEKKFDVIFCMEVFEHLNKNFTIEALNNIDTLLSKKGVCIVSVPIETGLGGFLKNIVRIIIGETHNNGTLKNAFKTLFGIKIKRNEDVDYIPSHVGFSHNDFENLIRSENYRVIKRYYSPFSYFGPQLNSQVFFIIDKDN